MNACMHGLTVVCVCVYVCVCCWVVRFTCLQGGAVSIYAEGRGTFTNCNFTSNSVNGSNGVSLEEEHVDDCEMSKCKMPRLYLPYMSS